MSTHTTLTILGCGSSGGVPRLSDTPGGNWGACDPQNPKNRRRRCSVLLRQTGPEGETRVLIDTTPDMRAQLLDAGVGTLDAVVYTHSHADHMHGIDDLRMITFNLRHKLAVWADAETSDALIDRFGYAVVQPKGSDYPPILDLNLITGPVTITGTGGDITLTPFTVTHGNIDALGFRIGDLAYIPDVSDIPEAAWAHLQNLDTFIIDALRYTPHPSHAHLDKTLGWIEQAAPRAAILTNMHIDLDYETLNAETPAHVTPAHDGLTIPITGPTP